MKKTLYITRHGETDYNKAGLVQGQGIDIDLNELGMAQGRAFCDKYKSTPFKKVYTSNLIRTWQTVDGIIKTGLPWEKLADLNEMNYGVYEGKPIEVTPGDKLFDVKNNWFDGNYEAKVEKGESPMDVVHREKRAINVILADKDESPVLVCMHGRALRIMLSWMLKTEIRDMENYKTPNTCVYIMEYDYDTKEFTCKEAANVDHLKVAAGDF
ncbi:histidine phosphatase family protein [Bacteroidales bacterium]|nr:histidine phosphatase family protein [Bacteroidales bacterium]